jgi:hypothetical protein
MKTRELLGCETRVFGERVARMKSKELRRHIERVAVSLGEPDPEELMRVVIDSVFSDQGLPESSHEEMRRVLAAIEGRVGTTEDNQDAILRLMALCVAFLRRGMRQAIRDGRRAPHPHDADECRDPGCTEHGHPAERA